MKSSGAPVFSLYLLPIDRFNITYNLFANDIQLNFSFKPSRGLLLGTGQQKHFYSNTDKTEVLDVALKKLTPMIMQNTGSLSSAVH